MALIDVSANIKGESSAKAVGGVIMNVTAELRGISDSGLVRPRPPAEIKSEPATKPKSGS